MKKLLKAISILIAAFCLFGCENPVNDENENKNRLNMSEKVDDVVLEYNDWGSVDYSIFQSDAYELTELFNGQLPEAGDSINFYWKGKCNRDVKKLHILVFDINPNEDSAWIHLLQEKQNVNPLATDIKANKEFEITRTITLDKTPEYSVWVALCCGAEDTDGPVHLYSSETENTENYDEYMKERGNAIMNSPIKVLNKGKMIYNKSNKSLSFTDLPKIKYSENTILDASKEDEKQQILNKGYFSIRVLSDDFKVGYVHAIGNTEYNSCGHEGWNGVFDTFEGADLSSLVKEETSDEPIYGQCIYFALADENTNGITIEDLKKTTHDENGEEIEITEKCYYYFPVNAFEFIVE